MTPAPFEEYKHLLYKEGLINKSRKCAGYNTLCHLFITKGNIADQLWPDGTYRIGLLNNGLEVFIGDAINIKEGNIKYVLENYRNYIYIGDGIHHACYY
mgnify:CR=1 FL=1